MKHQHSAITTPCHRFDGSKIIFSEDRIAHEAMLAIDIISGSSHNRSHNHLATILRMPGHDEELVLGLLFSLGLITNFEDIKAHEHCFRSIGDQNSIARFIVELVPEKPFLPLNYAHAHARHSSCGFCGSTGELPKSLRNAATQDFALKSSVLFEALAMLRPAQTFFNETGGTHGAALFSLEGQLLALFEDVGRHNALDKVIGFMLKQKALPLCSHLLLMTSRASYEIVQKASMASIPIVGAMGAVSTLAVENAHKNHITLIGFLRDERLNIYTHPERIA